MIYAGTKNFTLCLVEMEDGIYDPVEEKSFTELAGD
jgi:hypothetical protein